MTRRKCTEVMIYQVWSVLSLHLETYKNSAENKMHKTWPGITTQKQCRPWVNQHKLHFTEFLCQWNSYFSGPVGNKTWKWRQRSLWKRNSGIVRRRYKDQLTQTFRQAASYLTRQKIPAAKDKGQTKEGKGGGWQLHCSFIYVAIQRCSNSDCCET